MDVSRVVGSDLSDTSIRVDSEMKNRAFFMYIYSVKVIIYVIIYVFYFNVLYINNCYAATAVSAYVHQNYIRLSLMNTTSVYSS